MDEKEFNIETIKCKQCGSSDIELITEEYAQCKQCSAKIFINKPAPSKIVINKIIQSNNVEYYAITKERSVEDFRREALITLASNINTPPDIFEAEFKPIRSEYVQYLKVEANFFATFSATIGYDRKEEYIEYDTVRDSHGGTRRYPVTKTRTVTDWQPFSGSSTEFDYGYTNLIEDNFDDVIRFQSLLDFNANDLQLAELDKTNYQVDIINPSTAQINSALKYAENRFRNKCEKELPGNRHKDFNCHITHTITKTTCYIVPQYVLPFKFVDKEWQVESYKASNYSSLYKAPNAAKAIKSTIDDETKGLAIFSSVSSLVSILLSIILVLCLKSIITVIAISLGIILSIIAFTIYMVKHKKTNNLLKELLQEDKKQALIKHFSEHNLSPLTDIEENRFNDWRKKK